MVHLSLEKGTFAFCFWNAEKTIHHSNHSILWIFIKKIRLLYIIYSFLFFVIFSAILFRSFMISAFLSFGLQWQALLMSIIYPYIDLFDLKWIYLSLSGNVWLVLLFLKVLYHIWGIYSMLLSCIQNVDFSTIIFVVVFLKLSHLDWVFQ